MLASGRSFGLQGPRLETRSQSDVTDISYGVVVLWLVGIVLTLISFGLIFKRSGRTPTLVAAAALLSVPTIIADQAGLVHANNLPTSGITLVELVKLIAAAALIISSLWVRRSLEESGF